MIRTIKYDEATGEFVITLNVPRKMSGKYTLDSMAGIEDGDTWEQDAVCVWIDNSRYDYGLYNTQYLDYKGSLQATSPIIHFDSEKEAEAFAVKYGLMIEYGSKHDHFVDSDD